MSWVYKPTPPWILIILTVAIVFTLINFAFVAWRRRQRRLALEAYAMKRIRRKFKAETKQGGTHKILVTPTG